MQKSISAKPYQTLISWLVEQRRSQGITMPDLADRLGLASHSYISKIESFERKIDIYEYMLICQALNVDGVDGYNEMLKAQSTMPKKSSR